MIHFVSGLQWDSVRFHHATQNAHNLKLVGFFIFGIFHLIICSHCSGLCATETTERKIIDNGVTLYNRPVMCVCISVYIYVCVYIYIYMYMYVCV